MQDFSNSGEFVNVGFFYAQENDGLDLLVPSVVPFGPLRLRSWGGTSSEFPLEFDQIVATATSGTPANPLLPSANPGQAITIEGSGFDLYHRRGVPDDRR